MFKKINSKLENLFDQKSQTFHNIPENITIAQNNFQIVNNNQMLENLSYIFSNEINQDNLSNLFSQLSSYFEIGFLMNKKNGAPLYTVKEAFLFSKKIDATENLKPIKLPTTEIYKILKTNAHSFLNHFGLGNLDAGKKMISYLIPITDTYTVVVITQTAEPWVKLKIESLQKTFMKINFSI